MGCDESLPRGFSPVGAAADECADVRRRGTSEPGAQELRGPVATSLFFSPSFEWKSPVATGAGTSTGWHVPRITDRAEAFLEGVSP